MVYQNVIKYTPSDPGYADESWRHHHGYRELHQHDPPFRRNRDFKPVPYGTFGGMPNYRHAEAFCQMKNAKDLFTESHHFPTVWTKEFLKGALGGVIFGFFWHAHAPQSGLAVQKLMAATGERAWSGRIWR